MKEYIKATLASVEVVNKFVRTKKPSSAVVKGRRTRTRVRTERAMLAKFCTDDFYHIKIMLPLESKLEIGKEYELTIDIEEVL